jgi:hypothetical protein
MSCSSSYSIFATSDFRKLSMWCYLKLNSFLILIYDFLLQLLPNLSLLLDHFSHLCLFYLSLLTLDSLLQTRISQILLFLLYLYDLLLFFDLLFYLFSLFCEFLEMLLLRHLDCFFEVLLHALILLS